MQTSLIARNKNTPSTSSVSNAQTIITYRPRLNTSQSRLTWTFAFLTLMATVSFLFAHVLISSWFIHPTKKSNAVVSTENESIKKIVVLGSHHTGTSIITRLIIEMGAYPGKNLLMLPGNPLKYFENKEAVEINKQIMSTGVIKRFKKGPYWVNYGFSWNNVPLERREAFSLAVNQVVQELNKGAKDNDLKAWVLKDPRLSTLADQWIPKIPGSICVIVVRNPWETSVRLARTYNRENEFLNVNQWSEIWEASMFNAVQTCLNRNRKIVFAQHSLLMADPLQFAQRLEEDLFGTINKFTDEKVIRSILGDDFQLRARVDENDKGSSLFWTKSLKEIWECLSKENLSHFPTALNEFLFKDKEAYATIVTGNNKGFVAGALALSESIRNFDKKRDLVALISVEVDDPGILDALNLAGWKTHRVDKLEEPWYQTHPKCRDFTSSQRVRWGRMFSKLRIYELPYDRVVYLDTDTIVLRGINDYFTLPGEFYGERSPSHRGINAGIMVVKPSEFTLRKLIEYARNNEPMVFWPMHQVGCTEQELLNRYWSGERPERKLNNTRHFDYLGPRFLAEEGREENKLYGPRIAHCLTTKCNKPWDVPLSQIIRNSPSYNLHAIQPNCDPIMYLKWFQLYLSSRLEKSRNSLNPIDTSNGNAGLIPNPDYGLREVEKELADSDKNSKDSQSQLKKKLREEDLSS